MIQPQQFELENTLKRTRNLTEPHFVDTLLDVKPSALWYNNDFSGIISQK